MVARIVSSVGMGMGFALLVAGLAVSGAESGDGKPDFSDLATRGRGVAVEITVDRLDPAEVDPPRPFLLPDAICLPVTDTSRIRRAVAGNAKIKASLDDHRVSVDFREVVVEDAMRAVTRSTDIQVDIDPKCVDDAPPITLRVSNIPLANTLKFILRMADLHSEVRNGVLVISNASGISRYGVFTAEAALFAGPRHTKTFEHVLSGLEAKANVRFDRTPLCDVITHLAERHFADLDVILDCKTVPNRREPVTLNVNDGPVAEVIGLLLRQARLRVVVLDGVLFFTRARRAAEILWPTLAGGGMFQSHIHFAPARHRSAEEIQVLRALDGERLPLGFVRTSVSDAIDFLRDLTGVNMALDPNAVEDCSPITMNVRNVPLKGALKTILHFCELDYRFSADTLFISNRTGLEWSPSCPHRFDDYTYEQLTTSQSMRDRLMEERTDVDLLGATLPEAVRFMRKATNVNFAIDPTIPREDRRITLKARNLRAIDVLDYVLYVTDLDCEYQHEILMLTSHRVREIRQLQREGSYRGRGWGVLVSPDGHILTEHRLVEMARKICVFGPDGKRHEAVTTEAQTVGRMAIIKIPGQNWPHVRLPSVP